MRRAVFDTNVIVSGFLSPNGAPGRIVDWLRSGAIQAILDDRIVAEYQEVLLRPRLHLPPSEVALVLAAISRRALRVETLPKHEAKEMPDPDDAPFLECARVGEVPLVTGNLRHFPKRIAGNTPILTPAQFIISVTAEGG